VLIGVSYPDKQFSTADSGFVFYLLSIKPDEERKNNWTKVSLDTLASCATSGQTKRSTVLTDEPTAI
jgi:hypothetical protein